MMAACKSEFTIIIAKGPSEQDDPGKRKNANLSPSKVTQKLKI
jgi:hypothetical protein